VTRIAILNAKCLVKYASIQSIVNTQKKHLW